MNSPIPVVDVFAGSGGLGEGFSALRRNSGFPYDVRLSIEKDQAPIETLWTRAFYHQFRKTLIPESYYEYVRGEIDRSELSQRHPSQAREANRRCLQIELGHSEATDRITDERIRQAIAGADDWVLIGGPPCQAYSTIGRVKNRSLDNYNPDTDKRFDLYLEYLKIIGTYWPTIFLMENVRGLLSASRRQESIFNRMLFDLRDPATALALDGVMIGDHHCYRLYSLTTGASYFDDFGEAPNPPDFVVKSEDYGIPQARHRVIILGVRDDVCVSPIALCPKKSRVHSSTVLDGLPRVRSGLSKADSPDSWFRAVKGVVEEPWWNALEESIRLRISDILENLEVPRDDRGRLRFLDRTATCGYKTDWFQDDRLSGTLNHYARSHRIDDLWRYLFAACFMEGRKQKFRVSDFPAGLRPRHKNIYSSLANNTFVDRFSVQPKDAPSRTVVSHIRKDGHYYIHYDPTQCRSLTVREAARLQTFPDNYFFEGTRTDQYGQVGNAVPPLLSLQMADRVIDLLERWRAQQISAA